MVPQAAGAANWINACLLPPPNLLTAAMNLAMVYSAQRDGKFVTNFTPERAALRKAQMMSIRGLASANQTWLPGDQFDVLAVSHAPRLGECECAFVDRLGALSFLWCLAFGILRRTE